VAKWRVNLYSKAFRLMTVERMRSCEDVSVLAKELGVDRTVLFHWKDPSGPADESDRVDHSSVRELLKGVHDLKRVLPGKRWMWIFSVLPRESWFETRCVRIAKGGSDLTAKGCISRGAPEQVTVIEEFVPADASNRSR
jgi:hypothetical protein